MCSTYIWRLALRHWVYATFLKPMETFIYFDKRVL